MKPALQETPSKNQPTALQVLLRHQEAIDAAEAEVAKIEGLIAQRESEIAQAIQSVPGLEERQREREDLLAAIAAGEGSEKELKALDQRIETERAAASKIREEADRKVSELRQVIAGLARRLERAHVELQDLKEQTAELHDQMLIAEAEQACVAYVNAALKLKESYLQLSALNTLLGGRRSITNVGWGKLFLPTFNLPGCGGLGREAWPGTLFSAASEGYGDTFPRAEEMEKARLKALGVQF